MLGIQNVASSLIANPKSPVSAPQPQFECIASASASASAHGSLQLWRVCNDSSGDCETEEEEMLECGEE